MRTPAEHVKPLLRLLSVVFLAMALGLGAWAQDADAGKRNIADETVVAEMDVSAAEEDETNREPAEEEKMPEPYPGAEEFPLEEGDPADTRIDAATPVLGIEGLRRLLGETPDFVYDHRGHRDPMLLPWTHFQGTAAQTLYDAQVALQTGNLEGAEKGFNEVRRIGRWLDANGFLLSAMKKTLEKALGGLRSVEEKRLKTIEEEYARMVAEGEAVPELPPWVAANTRAVLYSTDLPLCLVGPYVLAQGEAVPLQPVEVTVEKIEPMAVTYRVQGDTFVISLEEGE